MKVLNIQTSYPTKHLKNEKSNAWALSNIKHGFICFHIHCYNFDVQHDFHWVQHLSCKTLIAILKVLIFVYNFCISQQENWCVMYDWSM